MAVIDEFPTTRGQVPCSYHPSVMTGLRCSRCGKPICPQCGVRTPVGLRCPDCAGVRGLPTYRTGSATLAKAGGIGLAIAVGVGVVWGLAPEWGFYLALALGFGVAEGIAWASNAKRGPDLQLLALSLVALGLVVSRIVLAQRLGIPWSAINQLTEPVVFYMRLQLIPDVLYAVLPFLIAWVRFR